MYKRLFIVVLFLSVCVGVSVQADDYLDDVYYWNAVGASSDDYTADNQTNTEQEDYTEEETPELLLNTYQTDAYNPGEFTHAVVTFVEDSTLDQATQVRAIIHRY